MRTFIIVDLASSFIWSVYAVLDTVANKHARYAAATAREGPSWTRTLMAILIRSIFTISLAVAGQWSADTLSSRSTLVHFFPGQSQLYKGMSCSSEYYWMVPGMWVDDIQCHSCRTGMDLAQHIDTFHLDILNWDRRPGIEKWRCTIDPEWIDHSIQSHVHLNLPVQRNTAQVSKDCGKLTKVI